MKKRNFGLDVIRVIAAFFVVAVHFFLNTDFYNIPVRGKLFFVLIIFRWLFFIAVPLFLLLTGYLQANKKLEKKYYKGIIRILISYVFISIITLIFKFCYLHQGGSRLAAIISIFSFQAIPIAWYIKMYIGLFLLIPFLNILNKGIESKKGKQWLILTLLFITSISPVINYIKIRGVYLTLIPDFWTILYPLVYYFIGCYIREYEIKIPKLKGTLAFIGVLLIETIATYFYSYNKLFSWAFFGGYNCIISVFLATTLFLLLYQLECKKPIILKNASLISKISLDIYLFSWISDQLVYNKFTTIRQEYMYLPLYILSSFGIALLLSLIKKGLFSIVGKIYQNIKIKKGINN